MSYNKPTNAYDTPSSTYLESVDIQPTPPTTDGAPERGTVMPSPSVDITSMGQPQYRPYAGAYSESSWAQNNRHSVAATSDAYAKGGSLDGADTVKPPFTKEGSAAGSTESGGSLVGMEQMTHWRAFRFYMYILTRLLQIIIAIVCVGYLASSRKNSTKQEQGGTERNVEIVVYIVGSLTAISAAVSIALHIFARTRNHMRKSRLSWFTLSLNFVIFLLWIILVLINVIVIDCSIKNEGSWCRDIKTSQATALISAMLALVVVIRSFTILVRADRVRIVSSKAKEPPPTSKQQPS
ncbi:hypothetical protein GQ54DRAFT_300466 [Martensiomyces pterosporus]|nr:hypothetical protein GQ54DRAFT_300466 [Martensiomyces pterosporus]